MQERLYRSTAQSGDELYFAPYSANEIAVYNFKKNTFRKIPVEDPRLDYHRSWEKEKFFNTVALGDKIYFFPWHYPGILCYDIKNDSLFCIDGWVEEVEKIHVGEWGYFISLVVVGTTIILPCACADAVVILDTITQKTKLMRTSPTEYLCKFCGICHVGKYFYLVSADGSIAKWEGDPEEKETRVARLTAFGKDDIEFYPVCNVNEDIFLFPFKNNSGYRFDTKTDMAAPINTFNDEKEYEGYNFLFLTSFFDGKEVYAVAGNSRRFMEFDLIYDKKDGRKIFPSENSRRLIESIEQTAFVEQACRSSVPETEDKMLKYMCSALQAHGNSRNKINSSYRNKNGERIYGSLNQENACARGYE